MSSFLMIPRPAVSAFALSKPVTIYQQLSQAYYPSSAIPTSRRRNSHPRQLSLRATLPPPSLTNPPHTFEGISWPQVELMCAEIATRAIDDRFDVVLGVTRGGMVPATLICEALRLRNMLSATVIFYTDAGDQFYGMTEPRFLSFPSAGALEGRRVLVVDDVWDSGRTATAVKRRVERAEPELVKVAVLHFKPSMNLFRGLEPDFYCAVTENWVVYPWEKASPDAPVVELIPVDVTQHTADQESAPISSNG